MKKCYAEDNSNNKQIMYSIKYYELKNIQNLLETFLTETERPNIKSLYTKAMGKLDEVIEISTK